MGPWRTSQEPGYSHNQAHISGTWTATLWRLHKQTGRRPPTINQKHIYTQTYTETKTYEQTQTDRQTDRQRDRQTERERREHAQKQARKSTFYQNMSWWTNNSFRTNWSHTYLCYNCLNSTAPDYLTELLRIYTPTRQLRSSSDTSILCIPTVRTHSLGQRAFSYAAPTVWNTLPYEIRSSNTISSFKSSLKTYLFQQSYWLCVCVCVWGGTWRERWERGGEGRRKGGRGERDGELVVYRKVWDFFSPLILFHVIGLVLRRRNGTEKNTLLWLLLLYR